MENPLKMDDLGVPLFSETPWFAENEKKKILQKYAPPTIRYAHFSKL